MELRILHKLLPTITILLMLAQPGAAARAQAEEGGGRLAFAAYRSGQWDIYSMAEDGSDIRQLTDDAFEESDPAYSPDGSRLAFAARRNNNWDIYLLDLASGEETRLTTSPHYDGAPAWHPDGQRLAYESFQAGDLDIWQVDAGGEAPAINLTAESPAGDFAPAWSPDGEQLAFTSWRSGDRDLFLMDVDGGQIVPLTNSPAAEEWPAWHPDGQTLAFVRDELGDREVYTLNVDSPPAEGGPIEHITWLGRTDGPTWGPDGLTIAALFHRWNGEILTLNEADPLATHHLPTELTPAVRLQGRPTWHADPLAFGSPVITLLDLNPDAAYEETLTPNDAPGAEPYNLIRQNDIETGTPWLADTVDDSFQAWRRHIYREVGFDFLQTLSDAARDVASYTENSQYASWHKSGRAIDTLFDYYRNGQLMHEIVREEYSGETYWRTYLRCIDQSGRCGRPLTANPWDYSRQARTEIAPEQGGIERLNKTGYYLDMTALARTYGWRRISSYDDEDFSWTWHFTAFEYWHYQKRAEREGAANWYEAMQEVYPQSTLDEHFNWQRMRQLGDNAHLIALKGVPLPLEMKPWWVLIVQP